jgi:putative membrane protein
MKNCIGWMLLAAMVAVAACDDDDNGTDLSRDDRDFLRSAAYANLAEVEMGQLAEDEATDEDVQDFGSHMVMEHTTAWNELEDLAQDEDYNLPENPDDAHQDKLDYLMTLSGYQFDTAYVNSQVKDHQLAITLFTTAKNNADDDDVRAYATKYLPHLQEHLTTALELQAALTDEP